MADADLTTLLARWSDGDRAALERLVPLVYADLRRIAANRLKAEQPGHTLSATAVAHEVYLRLVGQRSVRWQDRAHFFAVASQLMRRILVDHARRRTAAKRGGQALRVELDEGVAAGASRDLDLLDLDRALEELGALDARAARLVELRFFGGLSLDEAALALGVSRTTASREWALARGWLHRRLAAPPEAPRSE